MALSKQKNIFSYYDILSEIVGELRTMLNEKSI